MLVTFLTVIFVILALFLALFVLIQQGKGDMGMGALGGSAQVLFGGSGGQTFFEKATWTLGLIFMFGAMGLGVLKTRQITQSRLNAAAISSTSDQQKPSSPVKQSPATEDNNSNSQGS